MSISLNHDATLRKAFLILESVLTVNTYVHTYIHTYITETVTDCHRLSPRRPSLKYSPELCRHRTSHVDIPMRALCRHPNEKDINRYSQLVAYLRGEHRDMPPPPLMNRGGLIRWMHFLNKTASFFAESVLIHETGTHQTPAINTWGASCQKCHHLPEAFSTFEGALGLDNGALLRLVLPLADF